MKKTTIICTFCNGTGKVEIEDQNMAFGYKVAMARKKAGLTQEELAHKFGVTRTSITNIEAGRQSPPIDKVYELATLLGVTMQELV